MHIGDIVARKSYNKDIMFKIVDILEAKKGNVYVLEGINLRIIANSLIEDLEIVSKDNVGKTNKIYNTRINASIKKVLIRRLDAKDSTKRRNIFNLITSIS